MDKMDWLVEQGDPLSFAKPLKRMPTACEAPPAYAGGIFRLRFLLTQNPP